MPQEDKSCMVIQATLWVENLTYDAVLLGVQERPEEAMQHYCYLHWGEVQATRYSARL